MKNGVLTTQHQEEFEILIQGMIEHGFGYCDNFLDNKTVTGLRNKLLRSKREGSMKPAGIGRKLDFQENTRIRGDVIKWIENIPETFMSLCCCKKSKHLSNT
jgi:SM-20-related protein